MTYVQIISALGDPSRRHIVELLRRKPANVATLATQLPISRPAVSQHLKVLSDAGLLVVKTKGTSRIYQLNPDGVDELRKYLDGLWGDALSAFEVFVTQQVKND